MKALRILNSLPSFYLIYSLFPHSYDSKFVFEDSYYFLNNRLPSEKEFKLLDQDQIQINDLIVLSAKSIDQFGPRFRVSANCIRAYGSLDSFCAENILFKNLLWDWAYYCHDDAKIEVFLNNKHEDIYGLIKQKYECSEIDFPGSIKNPGGMNIL